MQLSRFKLAAAVRAGHRVLENSLLSSWVAGTSWGWDSVAVLLVYHSALFHSTPFLSRFAYPIICDIDIIVPSSRVVLHYEYSSIM